VAGAGVQVGARRRARLCKGGLGRGRRSRLGRGRAGRAGLPKGGARVGEAVYKVGRAVCAGSPGWRMGFGVRVSV
jgi:hypothetical protein